jgi:hypothetical protein
MHRLMRDTDLVFLREVRLLHICADEKAQG